MRLSSFFLLFFFFFPYILWNWCCININLLTGNWCQDLIIVLTKIFVSCISQATQRESDNFFLIKITNEMTKASRYLVLSWYTRLKVIWMVLRLSAYKSVEGKIWIPKSLNRLLNKIISLQAEVEHSILLLWKILKQ